jgi:hypothetical protein
MPKEMPNTPANITELANQKLNGMIRWAVGKELAKLPSLLGEGEEVMNVAQGMYADKNGLVAVTNCRVMFVEEGLMRSRLEDFPYGRISSVQTSTGWTAGDLTIFASGNKTLITRVMPKERVNEVGDYVRSRISAGEQPASTPVSPTAPAPPPDIYEHLRKLGELRDAGVLSQQEFDLKKAELLERL